MVTLFNMEKISPGLASDSQLSDKQKDTAISSFTNEFLNNYQKRLQEYYHGAGPTIRVSGVLGSIALLYERIRSVVEYKGDMVLRRNAIERILKRLLWERAGSHGDKLAFILIRELIWAHYLSNDTIPKEKIFSVGKIINKYLYFLDLIQEKGTPIPTSQLKPWIWGVASCEIEETLDPINREDYIMLMYGWFNAYFNWKDDIDEHEKHIQIYLAIHRCLTRSDEEIMRYHLLLKEFPQWLNADAQIVRNTAENFFHFYEEIEKHLLHPYRFKLFRIMQKNVAPFEILKELISREKEVVQIFNNVQILEQKVREICLSKYLQIQKKVNRGIIRSILYIFVTKVVLAMLIEIPYEMYRFNKLTYIPIAINIIVPPAMMFLIGLTIKAPGENNTQRILTKIKTIIYFEENISKNTFSINLSRSTSLLSKVFTFIYALFFVLIFGVIAYLLIQLNFNIVGICIFFAFLSLVLLFGFRVRFTASELKVTSDKETIFSYIFNNLTLPFLSTGVYLSKGLAKINFFTVILDFLIEAPLKTIIAVIEEWTSFIREKRDEVVEVPDQ